MSPLTDESLLSIENECLTVVYGSREERPDPMAMQAVLERLAQLAPSLPSPSGVANGYGIVYPDPTGHPRTHGHRVRFALLAPHRHGATRAVGAGGGRGAVPRHGHADHPRQQYALRPVPAEALSDVGSPLQLPGGRAPFAVRRPDSAFLATRIYAGAGVVQYPDGCFLANSRAPYMECDVGGGTTDTRAIHSTARDESHVGPDVRRWRYHLICGDGHRSHFNLALQFGCTLAALKAVFFNPRLPERLPRFCRGGSLSLVDRADAGAQRAGPARTSRRAWTRE